MYILEIMPISKGMPLDILTYYSKDIVNAGDLISVNIGHQKDIKALVIDSDSLINRKQDVKSKDWATKKINNVIASSIISPAILYNILKASIQYELPTGTMLSLLYTKKFWDSMAEGDYNSVNDKVHKAQSTLYIVPTQNQVKYKQSEMKGKCIVSTPCLDSLVDNNIEKVILSNYESPYYIHPHYNINMGLLLESVLVIDSKIANVTDTNMTFERERYVYNVDKVEILRDEYKYITPLISAVTDKLINNLYKSMAEGKNGKILIYANRKGESPLSRCYDCGLDMLCPSCHMPLVLHKVKDTKYYLCHHCGHRDDIQMPGIQAEDEVDDSRIHINSLICKHCGGWRIMPIGISTGSVEAHLLEKYSFIKGYLYRIDQEATNSDKKVKDTLKAWNDNGGILITNDKGLFHPYINNINISYSIVISLDGMYSIPDPLIGKRIIHIINKLNHITRKQVIVHTHLYENTVLQLIEDKANIQSNIEEYDEELRKKINLLS